MSSLASIRKDASIAVLEKVFNTNFTQAYGFLNQIYDEKVEIEGRFTEYSDHCPIEYWHILDGRMRLITDVYEDYVKSVDNPNLRVPFMRFRKYKYGEVKQLKMTVCRFGTTQHSNSIPFMFRLSKEIDLIDLGDIEECISMTQRLFRQSFQLISTDARPLLSNWRVDKSVRFFMEGDCEDIPIPNDFTIDKPTGYSMIDIEFEFDNLAPRNQLLESCVQLVDFLNSLIQPKLYVQFNHSFVMFEKLISTTFKEKMFERRNLFEEMRILTPTSIDPKPINIPLLTLRCVLMLMENGNWLSIFENEIDDSNFKGYTGQLFSMISCFKYDDKYIPIDIGIYESRVVNKENLEDRIEILNKIVIDFPDLFTFADSGEMVIHRTEVYNHLQYVPSEFIIPFKLAMCKNECEYHLLTSNDIPFHSPFIYQKSFSPIIGRSMFEDSMNKCIPLFDGKTVEFKIEMNGNKMEIRPIRFTNDGISAIEALHVMFRAYYSWAMKKDRIHGEVDLKESSIFDILLQVSIERLFNKDVKSSIMKGIQIVSDFLSNICIFVPEYSMDCSQLLYITSLIMNSENLIVHGSPKNLIMNLDEYFNPIHHSRPIFNLPNVTMKPNVFAIDENNEISNVGEFFTNDMNGIITPFLKLNVKRLISTLEYIFENRSNRCIVILNILDGIVLTHYAEPAEEEKREGELPFECRLPANNFIEEYGEKYTHVFDKNLLRKLVILFDLTVHVNTNPFETVCEKYYSTHKVDDEFGAIIDIWKPMENTGVLFTKSELSREDILFIIEQARIGWIVVVCKHPIYLTSVQKIGYLSSNEYIYSSIPLEMDSSTNISKFIYNWLLQENKYSLVELVENMGSILHFRTEKHVIAEDQELNSIIERDIVMRRKFLSKEVEYDLSNFVSLKLTF